jgi:hypothetical protein
MEQSVTTLWLLRWAELTPQYRLNVMKDPDDDVNDIQELIIDKLITEMVEPVYININYILQLIECKLRIESVINEENCQDLSYEEARYSNTRIPHLDKIKKLIISSINYENSEFLKGNIVVYHAYASVYQFVKQRYCQLPIEEIERIKLLEYPEQDPNYCFLSINYSLLCNFRPQLRGENTLWYVTSNFSQTLPHMLLHKGHYPLCTKSGDVISVDISSLFSQLFDLNRGNLGILDIYSIPISKFQNHLYNADPGGILSNKLFNSISDLQVMSWEYMDNLQVRLYNYNNLPKITLNPN